MYFCPAVKITSGAGTSFAYTVQAILAESSYSVR